MCPALQWYHSLGELFKYLHISPLKGGQEQLPYSRWVPVSGSSLNLTTTSLVSLGCLGEINPTISIPQIVSKFHLEIGEGRSENCHGKSRALKLSQGSLWRRLPSAAMMWVVSHACLRCCCDSHACLWVWLPLHQKIMTLTSLLLSKPHVTSSQREILSRMKQGRGVGGCNFPDLRMVWV